MSRSGRESQPSGASRSEPNELNGDARRETPFLLHSGRAPHDAGIGAAGHFSSTQTTGGTNMNTTSKRTETSSRRRRLTRAAFLAACLPLTLTSPAGASPAVTTHDAQLFTVQVLPCAPDQDYFALTTTYNETWRMSDGDSHFTQTGTFQATPVEVTRFEDILDDDHDHAVPVEWQTRPGSDFVGRVTATGTTTHSHGADTTTFSVRIQGSGSAGEQFSLHYLSHGTETPDGSIPAAFEKGRCK